MPATGMHRAVGSDGDRRARRSGPCPRPGCIAPWVATGIATLWVAPMGRSYNGIARWGLLRP